MKEYLTCLKENQNNNGKCRHLSKEYLSCRMSKGLMGQDSFKNLGFQEEDDSDKPLGTSGRKDGTSNASNDTSHRAGSSLPSGNTSSK
ncbi:Cytochrome c oxidase assembly protein cox19 [Dissophora globulifera]|uniref:Cytochrome c oxidase assembly protein cox19 n=1 Tax=Dissophora globulifera TaxID=979702 RepID=A0A9P6R5P6_9FUNG|nr:Cytochrome c oxidase assembly protein cox19 [Dissophora globulifera]